MQQTKTAVARLVANRASPKDAIKKYLAIAKQRHSALAVSHSCVSLKATFTEHRYERKMRLQNGSYDELHTINFTLAAVN